MFGHRRKATRGYLMCLSRGINQVQVPAGLLMCSASPAKPVQRPCMAPHLSAASCRMLARISCRQISSRQTALRSMMCLHPTAVGSSRPLLALKVSGQGHPIFGKVSAVVATRLSGGGGCIVATCLSALCLGSSLLCLAKRGLPFEKRGWTSAMAVMLTAPSGLCSMCQM